LLPADIDELFAEVLQCLNRHRMSVYVTARASLSGHDTTQNAFIIVVQIVLLEPVPEFLAVTDVESGRDFATIGARTDGATVSSFTQGKRQCIDKYRFAGAGLSCQYVKAGPELQLDFIDNRQIMNMKVC